MGAFGGLALEDCVFCNVEKGRIVYEDDLFFVIRDGFPVSELHTLIIPKKHVASFFELGEPENTALISAIKKPETNTTRIRQCNHRF